MFDTKNDDSQTKETWCNPVGDPDERIYRMRKKYTIPGPTKAQRAKGLPGDYKHAGRSAWVVVKCGIGGLPPILVDRLAMKTIGITNISQTPVFEALDALIDGENVGGARGLLDLGDLTEDTFVTERVGRKPRVPLTDDQHLEAIMASPGDADDKRRALLAAIAALDGANDDDDDDE